MLLAWRCTTTQQVMSLPHSSGVSHIVPRTRDTVYMDVFLCGFPPDYPVSSTLQKHASVVYWLEGNLAPMSVWMCVNPCIIPGSTETLTRIKTITESEWGESPALSWRLASSQKHSSTKCTWTTSFFWNDACLNQSGSKGGRDKWYNKYTAMNLPWYGSLIQCADCVVRFIQINDLIFNMFLSKLYMFTYKKASLKLELNHPQMLLKSWNQYGEKKPQSS